MANGTEALGLAVVGFVGMLIMSALSGAAPKPSAPFPEPLLGKRVALASPEFGCRMRGTLGIIHDLQAEPAGPSAWWNAGCAQIYQELTGVVRAYSADGRAVEFSSLRSLTGRPYPLPKPMWIPRKSKQTLWFRNNPRNFLPYARH